MLKYLNYINPYHWLAVFITWYSKRERNINLAKAIIEANKQHKETGAKVVVLNTEKGIVVIRKSELKKRRLGGYVKKAFYSTK